MHTVLMTSGVGGISEVLVEVFGSPGAQVIYCSQKIKTNCFRNGAYEDNLDILINSAVIRVFKPFLEISLNDCELLMYTNFRGNFLCTQEAISRMINHYRGRVINIGSIINKSTRRMNLLYVASNFGSLQC